MPGAWIAKSEQILLTSSHFPTALLFHPCTGTVSYSFCSFSAQELHQHLAPVFGSLRLTGAQLGARERFQRREKGWALEGHQAVGLWHSDAQCGKSDSQIAWNAWIDTL